MRNIDTRAASEPDPDPFQVALREIQIAIELVTSGRARVVQLSGLEAAERAAGLGLALAQSAGVEFAVQRSSAAPDAVSLRVGPSSR